MIDIAEWVRMIKGIYSYQVSVHRTSQIFMKVTNCYQTRPRRRSKYLACVIKLSSPSMAPRDQQHHFQCKQGLLITFINFFPMLCLRKLQTSTQQKRHKNCTPSSVPKIKSYLGILFYMDVITVIQLPNYRAYWRSKQELRQKTISSKLCL